MFFKKKLQNRTKILMPRHNSETNMTDSCPTVML